MRSNEAQRYARLAGFLLLASLVAGGFGESYVPDGLVAAGDVAETARRLGTSMGLFRASFASYLVEAACDLALTAIFYVLLRPVSRTLSLISACFGLFATATFAVGEILYFAAGLPATDANVVVALTPGARESFTYLCLILYGHIFAIFSAFYGIAVMLRGYLILRCGYLPRALGGIVLVGGGGFVLLNFLAVLVPGYPAMMLVIPMLVAMVSLGLWLLIRGIKYDRWDRVANSSEEK